MINGQIGEFGEEFGLTKINLRWLMAYERALTELGEV
jgi:hypothetical protein